jgi:hypothetical protein
VCCPSTGGGRWIYHFVSYDPSERMEVLTFIFCPL